MIVRFLKNSALVGESLYKNHGSRSELALARPDSSNLCKNSRLGVKSKFYRHKFRAHIPSQRRYRDNFQRASGRPGIDVSNRTIRLKPKTPPPEVDPVCPSQLLFKNRESSLRARDSPSPPASSIAVHRS